MIIVSGRMRIRPGRRAEFLAASRPAVEAARRTAGCRDFIVAADPLEGDRVNVYEEWETEEALLAFRGDGPDTGMAELILDAHVCRHSIGRSGPA